MTSTTPVATPTRCRQQFTKPAVPFEPFPLTWHKHRGYWFKKYLGQTLIYEADAQASYDRWQADRDSINQGGKSTMIRKRFQLRDAVNLYLTRQKQRATEGKISDGQFAKCRRELEYWLPRAVALSTPLDSFRGADPADVGPSSLFHRIASKARARGLDAAYKHVVIVRAVLDWAATKKLMLPADYADDFDPPSPEQIAARRRHLDTLHGERIWTVDELRKILKAADALRDEKPAKPAPRNHHLYAQILLALFAGYGSDDCSALPEKAINFETGVVKYARAKSSNRPCMAILPKVALDALKWSREHRAETSTHLMFTTAGGKQCNVAPKHSDEKGLISVGRNDTIGQNFKRLLNRIGLHKKRTGFKSLRAACRTMLVGGGIHEDIIAVIMGRKLRYAVDDYYIRGELREEMVTAARHIESALFKQTGPRQRASRANGAAGKSAQGRAKGPRRAKSRGSA